MRHHKIAAFVISVMALAGCKGGESIGGFFDTEQSFIINLTPGAEVPAPQPTTASGSAQVFVFASRIDFSLAATNMTGITMAHIHDGAPGVAGPIVATLFLPGTPTGNVNGTFANGSIAESNLSAGVTLTSLKALLASGNAYINVHTVANPTGEIRGQLR